MTERTEKYEAFLDDLALVVEGDAAALERHADFLADDDEARDLRHEAAEVARELELAGADYAHPADFEARMLALLDGEHAPEDDAGRTTNPGFAAPDAARQAVARQASEATTEATREPTSRAPATRAGSARTVALEATPAPAGGGASPEAPREASERAPKRSMGKLLFFPLVGVIGLAAAAAAVGLFVFGGESSDEPGPGPLAASGGIDGTVVEIVRAGDDGESGVTVRRAGASEFVALRANEPVPAGATVRTDERTRARVTLSDGSGLVLDHATELELRTDAPRSLRLAEGNLVADVAHLESGPNAVFETATGRVEVLGTKFELSATRDVTNVRVSRGVVAVRGPEGEAHEVQAGEEGVVRAGAAPTVTPFTDLARRLAWAELGAPAEGEVDDEGAVAGIGSLRARRPGERQEQERPLHLARHSVRVRIVGNVARTEIEEVFRNDDDHTLEGVYRFPLPPDAQIASLSLDVEGRMEEGSFVERDRAAAIWRGVIRNATPVRQRQNDEEFIWVPGPWHDPAILEWQRGGQFELRIFPIPARGERRVILSYTQTVQPQGVRRQYTYPLAHAADGSTRVGQFDVDVRVAGAERVEASGYRVTEAADESAVRLTMTEQDFTPKGDLTIEYQLPGGEREVRYWTYQGDAAVPPPAASREQDREVATIQRQLADDRRPFVAFALRPELPAAGVRRARDYVLLVDASQSMFGERYQRASRLAVHAVREMDRRDRFTVLACDYQCQAMPGGVQPPSVAAAGAVEEWLDGVEPAGASDLSAVLREAAATVSAERRDDRELHVLYLGDGTSSVGYRRPAALAAEARAVASSERVAITTVGVGGDADTMALRAIASAAGGHYVPYVPGQRVQVAALALLETTYGASLEAPRVELPAGLSEVAPGELPTVRAGQEVIVVARMDREQIAGEVVLHGTVGGRPFERRYPVELRPSDAAGNRFVPRLWAAGRIEQMQLSGRGEDRARIIATSKAFGVLSRHTSLLVLESEAMFRAFRVDRNDTPVAQWTGDEDVVASTAGDALGAARGRSARSTAGYGGLAGLDADDSGGGGMGTRASGPPPPPMSAPRASAAREMSADGIFGGSGAAPVMREERARPTPDAAAQAQTVMPMPMPTRRPGQWMQRVMVRVGEVQPLRGPNDAARQRATEAEAALAARPDSRDRHRDAVRRLAEAGQLERALEVAEAWVARDREDAEALTAKADLVGRLGRRDEALRLLTGTVDLAPDNATLHQRLAAAFDRASRPERACAHRIALAEIGDGDAAAVADAMRCERALGRTEEASRILYSVREAAVRTRAERLAGESPRDASFRGDFTIEAEWDSPTDLDLSILTSTGTRLSWMGGRTTVVGADVAEARRERLGLRFTGAGTYDVEISRTDPTDRSTVRGRVRVRVLDQTREIPFTLSAERETIARVRVRRESRLVPVTGTVGPGFR
ncbi:MAG: FecR domain-containing protein [Sandaracinaceae bacterium]|nr:FecR domain-containing protein [Sandaracinaceae bacterium]